MRRLFIIPGLRAREGGCIAAFVGLVALVYFSIPPSILQAMHVHVRDGQEVRLSLRNILTTANAEKDDVIQFEVAEDVVVVGHTVIAKGAPATGKVVRVKGAGNKKAKDASVTFRLLAVQTVDNQQVPLRKHVGGENKTSDKENDFEEDQPIPGMVERAVGADKGKVYIVYLDASVVVNAPDTTTTPQTAPSAGQTATAPTGQPAVQPAATTPSTGALGQEPATVDFVTDPSVADIMIDGNFAGNTPSSLQVIPGRHTIELRLSGYRTYTRSMRIDEGSHPRISASLEKE